MTLTKAFLKPLYSRCLKIQLSSESVKGQIEEATKSFFEMNSSIEGALEMSLGTVSFINSLNRCLTKF